MDAARRAGAGVTCGCYEMMDACWKGWSWVLIVRRKVDGLESDNVQQKQCLNRSYGFLRTTRQMVSNGSKIQVCFDDCVSTSVLFSSVSVVRIEVE